MNGNDWDFPCSYTYRCAEAELNEGIRLPILGRRKGEPLPLEVQDTLIELEYQIAEFEANNQHRPLEQMRARVAHLEKQVWKLQGARTKRKKDSF